MKIKICGLSRPEDIDYANEAGPDFIGFVFAPSRRQVTPALAVRLRDGLSDGIVPVGVFVNAPAEDVAALYRDGIISVAQLHGSEDAEYIALLKEKTALGGNPPVPVIRAIQSGELKSPRVAYNVALYADYYLVDNGAGSGKTFDWNILRSVSFDKPWFLAGGIDAGNIGRAIAQNPFALDVSGGAETDGVKDREKIARLTELAKKGSVA
jgi:phosphoribosylanthranilate isomerase